MTKKSAGILAYRSSNGELEVLLVHPGGPFFIRKDLGVWSVPKGEFDDTEDPLSAAKREFQEETGVAIDGTVFTPLTPVRLKSGKTVYAWATPSALEIATVVSNTFPLEWPPKSGRIQQFAEVDKAEWFTVPVAKAKISPAQAAFIDELQQILKNGE